MQLGSDENQVECTGGGGSVEGDTQSCVVFQGSPGNVAGRNTARCIERSGSSAAVQICSIEQNGANNVAMVMQMVVSQGSSSPGESPDQTADQTTEVTQTTGAGGSNSTSVRQQVVQRLTGGDVQSQDAHQELTINQNAPGAGNNKSDVDQRQSQEGNSALTQMQNTSFGGTATPCPAATLYGVGNNPNQCVFVHEGTDSGDNRSTISQSLNEMLHSDQATDQHQGSFGGGMKAQLDLDAGTGTSSNAVRQNKKQDAHGPAGVSQQQIDPMGCCGFSAQGNASSRETLDQDSSQKATAGSAAVQDLSVFGFVHTPTGGSCSLTQQASDNGDSSNQTAESPDCTAGVGLATTCVNVEILEQAPRRSDAVGGCTSEPFFGGGD